MKPFLVYQCQRCEFVHQKLNLLSEHIQFEHHITDPLVEKVHFRNIAIGNLL